MVTSPTQWPQHTLLLLFSFSFLPFLFFSFLRQDLFMKLWYVTQNLWQSSCFSIQHGVSGLQGYTTMPRSVFQILHWTPFFKIQAAKMSQPLRAHSALTKDLSLVPRTILGCSQPPVTILAPGGSTLVASISTCTNLCRDTYVIAKKEKQSFLHTCYKRCIQNSNNPFPVRFGLQSNIALGKEWAMASFDM